MKHALFTSLLFVCFEAICWFCTPRKPDGGYEIFPGKFTTRANSMKFLKEIKNFIIDPVLLIS